MEQKVINRIKNELTAIDDQDLYMDFLNDLEAVNIGGYEYLQGTALKEVDPTAFRCGASDFIDSEARNGRYMEVGGEYFDNDEAQEIIDEMEEESDDE